MIDIITRVRHKHLYEGMIESAIKHAEGKIQHHCEYDVEHLPLCSKTYNSLADKSKAEIVAVVEDDVEFMSNGWDVIVQNIFKEYKPDILGVIGAFEYYSGMVFDAGYPHGGGILVTNKEGRNYIKVLSEYFYYREAKVIDGMCMFIDKKWLIKNRFDEKRFNEMWYYDIDLCLRGRVGITCDILVKHSTKGDDVYGDYPDKMKPKTDYDKVFNKKHHINNFRIGDQRCAMVPLEDFKKYGQDYIYGWFKNKYCLPAI